MTDIVEWLRDADEPLLDDYRIVCGKSRSNPNRLLEAADEIERLRQAPLRDAAEIAAKFARSLEDHGSQMTGPEALRALWAILMSKAEND